MLRLHFDRVWLKSDTLKAHCQRGRIICARGRTSCQSGRMMCERGRRHCERGRRPCQRGRRHCERGRRLCQRGRRPCARGRTSCVRRRKNSPKRGKSMGPPRWTGAGAAGTAGTGPSRLQAVSSPIRNGVESVFPETPCGSQPSASRGNEVQTPRNPPHLIPPDPARGHRASTSRRALAPARRAGRLRRLANRLDPRWSPAEDAWPPFLIWISKYAAQRFNTPSRR